MISGKASPTAGRRWQHAGRVRSPLQLNCYGLVLWVISLVTYSSTVGTFVGAKRLECVELAPAVGAPTLNDSASKLDALQTLRVTAMPIFAYVSVFRAAHS